MDVWINGWEEILWMNMIVEGYVIYFYKIVLGILEWMIICIKEYIMFIIFGSC